MPSLDSLTYGSVEINGWMSKALIERFPGVKES